MVVEMRTGDRGEAWPAWVIATMGTGTPGRKCWLSPWCSGGAAQEGLPREGHRLLKEKLPQAWMEFQGDPEQKTGKGKIPSC